ncbi:MAG TPA: Rpn family recombination-promoting nuclease/putative transposase [Myxococcota bacterium]|nr:Rpn family recombination-promoting nuclease/putative transposase [Myxococcota bacterium]
MPKPHDHIVKHTFTDLAVARAFLEGFLPARVCAALDLDTLRLAPTLLVDELLDERQVDLLFEVDRRGGGPLLIYLLVEHQSAPDGQMGRRLHRYVHHIWARFEQLHPNEQLLPPVIPLVVYHGAPPWPGDRRLHDHVALDGLPEPLRSWVPDFSYPLVDLRRLADTRLVGTALGRLVLLLLKYSADGDTWSRLPGWLDLLLQVVRAPGGMAAMSAIIRYISYTTPVTPPDDVQAFIRSKLGEPVMEIVDSWADTLVKQGIMRGIEQGIERGIEQGIEQGIERGAVLGKQDFFLQTARLRFGALPAAFVARVHAADADQLERWLERLLRAPSIDGVLDEP